MKNKIKKAPVKFRENLLYFQHFMLIFVFVPLPFDKPQKNENHSLNKRGVSSHFNYVCPRNICP